MNLLNRLIIATLAVCVGCAVIFWALLGGGRGENDDLTRDLGNERAARFDAAIRIQGSGLESLVSSYAWWDEMVKYMEKPSEDWAEKTIDNIVGIPNGGDAIWIVDTDTKLLHTIDKDYRKLPLPFESAESFQRTASNHYTFRFYARIDGALWEIFAAAIQDAKFWRNQTPVRGYLLLGKRWDDAWLAQLNTLVGARITIHPADAVLPATTPLREIRRPLSDLSGKPLSIVDLRFNFDLLDSARDSFNRRIVYLIIASVAAFALLFAIVAITILRPLGHIARSLEARQTTAITGLLANRSELGEIARLVAGQLRWGHMMQEEMRRQLERANPERVRREAESNETLRLRLAGNIHDGPIQSIYAAGLRLAAVQSEAEHGRATSAERITEIGDILRQASADLRNLILELEPEELRERDLEMALQQIERQLRQNTGCQFELQVADGALDGLSRDAQTHLYFICRELVSNAIRHARPTAVRLSFAIVHGFLEMRWFNNGVAEQSESTGGGHGLRNIERRVAELGGSIRHGPERDGWRLACELPLTSLTNPPAAPTI